MKKSATFVFIHKIKKWWSLVSINKINELLQFAEEVWPPHSAAYGHQAQRLREDCIFYVKGFYKSSV